MNLFVNDIPLVILKPHESPEEGRYNTIIDLRREPLTKAKLIHHVLLTHATLEDMNFVFDLLNSKVPISLMSLHIALDDGYKDLKRSLYKKYKVVNAAGGLPRKKDRFLMIYRLKRWDLPKGKKENGETNHKAAIREVEEECNVRVKLVRRICTTWHTYTMNRHRMIKKTKWYLMDVTNDSKMKPSLEEDIEELRWMTQKEVYHALENSYRSIQFVFQVYYDKNSQMLSKQK